MPTLVQAEGTVTLINPNNKETSSKMHELPVVDLAFTQTKLLQKGLL